MTPSWEIDDLLSALYFSIFYLNSELELYRQCANPRCSKWFLVRTTTTKKKYCSQECFNRVTQDKYRKNKRIEDKQKKICMSSSYRFFLCPWFMDFIST